MTYEKKFRIFFDDGDPGGILYFAKYPTKAHQLIEEFTVDSGIGWNNWYSRPGMGVPLRHIEADYRRPLRPGQEYLGRLAVKKIGNSSVQFEIEFLDGEEICAVINTAHVFVSTKDIRPMPIPEEIRNVLEKYLQS